eukprot:Platyproteum_vivax@DN6767_c0_g1_i1.p1
MFERAAIVFYLISVVLVAAEGVNCPDDKMCSLVYIQESMAPHQSVDVIVKTYPNINLCDDQGVPQLFESTEREGHVASAENTQCAGGWLKSTFHHTDSEVFQLNIPIKHLMPKSLRIFGKCYVEIFITTNETRAFKSLYFKEKAGKVYLNTNRDSKIKFLQQPANEPSHHLLKKQLHSSDVIESVSRQLQRPEMEVQLYHSSQDRVTGPVRVFLRHKCAPNSGLGDYLRMAVPPPNANKDLSVTPNVRGNIGNTVVVMVKQEDGTYKHAASEPSNEIVLSNLTLQPNLQYMFFITLTRLSLDVERRSFNFSMGRINKDKTLDPPYCTVDDVQSLVFSQSPLAGNYRHQMASLTSRQASVKSTLKLQFSILQRLGKKDMVVGLDLGKLGSMHVRSADITSNDIPNSFANHTNSIHQMKYYDVEDNLIMCAQRRGWKYGRCDDPNSPPADEEEDSEPVLLSLSNCYRLRVEFKERTYLPNEVVAFRVPIYTPTARKIKQGFGYVNLNMEEGANKHFAVDIDPFSGAQKAVGFSLLVLCFAFLL